MAAIGTDESLDMILIGRTGDGKSETGNTIVGRNVFHASSNLGSGTTKSQYDCCDFDNCDIKVVDCPGLGDTRIGEKEDLQQFIEAVKLAIANNPKGYHAFLYVLKFGNRFTRVDQYTIATFKVLFGHKFMKNHGIIVMTYGDCFEMDPTVKERNYSFEDWLSNQKDTNFKNLISHCKERAVIFNNRTDDSAKKSLQKRKLMSIISTIAKNTKRYTNADFQKAEKKRLELLTGLSKEHEKQNFINRIGILISRMKNVTDDTDGSKNLDILSQNIEELDNSIHAALQKNRKLSTTIGLIQNMRDVLKVKKTQIDNRNAVSEKSREKDLRKTNEQFQELEKKYVKIRNSCVEPFVPKIVESLKDRFSIESFFDWITNLFK